jgi:hypothetical protein
LLLLAALEACFHLLDSLSSSRGIHGSNIVSRWGNIVFCHDGIEAIQRVGHVSSHLDLIGFVNVSRCGQVEKPQV